MPYRNRAWAVKDSGSSNSSRILLPHRPTVGQHVYFRHSTARGGVVAALVGSESLMHVLFEFAMWSNLMLIPLPESPAYSRSVV